MSQSKLQLTIEKAHGNMWRVEMRDHYCNYACVYEPSVKQAMQYALYWFEKAEEREVNQQVTNKAIKEMIALDREAGITTSMSDGLD
jgi:hypothetical protein